jgi:Mor family transcriptional regulator
VEEKKAEAIFLGGKQNILAEIDRGVKNCEVARKYRISLSVLSAFIKDRARIEKNIDSDALGSERKSVWLTVIRLTS